MASLFVFEGNDQGARFELEDNIASIGRESSNSILLHDQEVSRHHAEVVRKGEVFSIRDLGSSNGTWVNSERVSEQVLKTGDRVLVGKTVMLFTGVSDDSALVLKEKVSIVADDPRGGRSRIVRKMGSAEGSQLLRFPEADEAEAPWLARARSNLEIMYRTALAVGRLQDIDQLLQRIMELIFDWVEADRGCILLVDPASGKLAPKAHFVREGKPAGGKLHISETILDYVRQHSEGVLTTNAQEDDRWNPAASILQQGIREAICVPMQGRYDEVGVIYIDTKTPPHVAGGKPSQKFSEEHLKLLIAIAHQAALAVEDTRYYHSMLQAERLAAIGQTIAGLSHDIKNILQGIRAASFLIKDGLSRNNEEMVRKGWEFVEKNQEKISNLVLDMLTFSKEREPEMVPGELNGVVGDVVELIEQRAAERRVQLVWRPDTSMPTGAFDPDGIHRATLNLVSNAIDACAERLEAAEEKTAAGEGATAEAEEWPAVVTVSTEFAEDERLARIVVEDTGAGIPPEQLEKIFTLFVSTKKKRGTGLGLAVSQKIATEHGGRIRVESQQGVGSRFTLQIPLAPAGSHVGDSQVAEPAAGR